MLEQCMTSLNLSKLLDLRSNEHVIEDFAKILYTLSVDIFYNENVKMIVEYNTYGTVLISIFKNSVSTEE